MNTQTIYLAGGCFWGLEAYFQRIDGVIDAVSGYANGKTERPSYEDVVYRQTGHAETVKVVYNTDKLSLNDILQYYFLNVNKNRPRDRGGSWFEYINYIRISASTPDGKLRFCKLSIVFGVASVMSMRRLCTRISNASPPIL